MGEENKIKKFQIVTESEKPAEKTPASSEQKPPTSTGKPDDVRSGLASTAPILANLLSGKRVFDKADDKKSDESGGSEKPKAEAGKEKKETPKADGEKKTDDSAGDSGKKSDEKSDEKPDDAKSRRILGVDPSTAVSDEKPNEPKESDGDLTGRIADVAAKSAATAAAETLKRVLPKQSPEPADEYPEDYRDSAKVLDQMAKMAPAKYGSIKKQLVEFSNKEREYRAMWEAKNEGQEFDADSDEHQEFYSKYAPDIDSDDIKNAEDAIEQEKIDTAVKRRVDEQLAPVRKEQAVNSIKPVISQNAASIAAATIKSVLPDVDVDNLTPEQLTKIQEDHPRELEIINAAASRAVPVLEAYLKISNGIEQIDSRNSVHSGVIDVVSRVQNFIAGRPKSQQVRVGDGGVRQTFLRVEEYVALPQSERSKHWTVGAAEVVAQLEIDAQDEAQSLWQKEKSVLERYGAKFGAKPNSDESQVMPSSHKQTAQNSQKSQEKPRIEVSQAGSERGGVGTTSDTVTLGEGTMFGKLMKSLRPARLK